MNKQSKKTPSLPSKADILAFIGNKPGKVGTREIARAFGLKNALRADLKRLLRELADEGSIEKRRKKLHHAGALPSTVLADVTARDSEGDLIATPDEWDEDAHGTAPKIRIHVPRKARPGEAAGLGDPRVIGRDGIERRARHEAGDDEIRKGLARERRRGKGGEVEEAQRFGRHKDGSCECLRDVLWRLRSHGQSRQNATLNHEAAKETT